MPESYPCLTWELTPRQLWYKNCLHIAIARGVDPDFPRNLAKSVTVR